MEFSLISKKSVSWNQPSFLSSDDSNSRLDVNVRVCNLQKLWVPVDFSESLASSKFPIVATAGDVIDLPSVRIGFETSGRIGPKIERRMYMKLSGVARFLEAVFGGNIPKNVIIRVDVPRLKDCLTGYSLTPELSSQIFSSWNGNEIKYSRRMKMTSKQSARDIFDAWRDPASRWTSKLTLTVSVETNDEDECGVLDMQHVTRSMFNDEFCDATIVTGNDAEIKCHRSILSAQCEAFAQLLLANLATSRSSVVRLPKISEETGRALVQFLYTRKTPVPDENPSVCFQLLETARIYKIASLQKKMEEIFSANPSSLNSLMLDIKVDLKKETLTVDELSSMQDLNETLTRDELSSMQDQNKPLKVDELSSMQDMNETLTGDELSSMQDLNETLTEDELSSMQDLNETLTGDELSSMLDLKDNLTEPTVEESVCVPKAARKRRNVFPRVGWVDLKRLRMKEISVITPKRGFREISYSSLLDEDIPSSMRSTSSSKYEDLRTVTIKAYPATVVGCEGPPCSGNVKFEVPALYDSIFHVDYAHDNMHEMFNLLTGEGLSIEVVEAFMILRMENNFRDLDNTQSPMVQAQKLPPTNPYNFRKRRQVAEPKVVLNGKRTPPVVQNFLYLSIQCLVVTDRASDIATFEANQNLVPEELLLKDDPGPYIVIAPLFAADHFYLSVFDFGTKVISVYDSSWHLLPMELRKGQIEAVLKVLTNHQASLSDESSPTKWTLNLIRRCCQQEDEYSCGIFTFHYADLVLRGIASKSHLKLSRRRVLQIRRQVAKELLQTTPKGRLLLRAISG